MPPFHGTTRSQDQPLELLGRRIGHQQRAASICKECDDPLPPLRCGVEARRAQRLANLGLLLDELGRDRVLDHDDPSPPIGEAGCWRSGKDRLPGAEELGVWPVESADGELEALGDGLEVRLARKVARHRPAAVGDRVAEQGALRHRPAGVAAAGEQRGSAGDADQYQRGCRRRCPASVPEESAPSRGGWTHLLDAPAQANRSSARGLLSERPREVLLQGQLALAARAAAQVFLDDAPLLRGQLAVGEWGDQLLEQRMFEGSLSHRKSFSVACPGSPSGSSFTATSRLSGLFHRRRLLHVATPRFASFSPATASSPASNRRPRLMRLMTVPIGTEVIWAISRYLKPCTS